MNRIQKYRLGVQFLCFILTINVFFINFRVTMLIIMGLTFLCGVFYCGWICPYGFIQDLFSSLGQLLGIKKRKMPLPIQKIMVFSRYVIFGLFFAIGTSLMFNIISFDPRVNFERLLLGNIVTISAIIIICFFSLISLFFERPFCNYLCFEGAKYGLMSIFRPFTITKNELSCINCKKCDKACPMNIKVSKCTNLRSPQCINCFKCISRCPIKNTLNYGIMKMKKGEKKIYFSTLGVVLILISSFLVYNISNETRPLSTENKHSIETTDHKIPLLNQEDIKTKGIADGIYTGEGEGFRGTITAKVIVKNEQIVAVEVVNHRDDRKWFDRANSIIPNRIIDTQSTDVNVVSGATYSSIGIIDAVKNALEKAK